MVPDPLHRSLDPRQLLPRRGLWWQLLAAVQVVGQSKCRFFKCLHVFGFAKYTLAADVSPQLKVKNELPKKKSYSLWYLSSSSQPKMNKEKSHLKPFLGNVILFRI